jgi:hypothetical protein
MKGIIMFTALIFCSCASAIESSKVSADDMAKIVATTMNKRAHTMAGPHARFETAEAPGGGVVLMHYTVLGVTKSKVSSTRFENVMRESLVKGNCKSAITLDAFRSGVKYEYAYSDSDGEKLATIDITNNDCE